jgi:hypothetical protein
LLSICSMGLAQQRLDLNFANAQQDPNTGALCFLQQVCIDPEATAKLLPSQCEPELPEGCDCAGDEDCGGGDAKCVACVCKSCPESARGGGPVGGKAGSVINPPLTFVIDTTKSVKPDKFSIFNLTQRVVEKIQELNANIPQYQLITFNDFGPNFDENVKVFPATSDVIQFKQEIISLEFESYTGGRDSKERLMQGLLAATNNVPDKSLVVVFTDNGSKDLALRQEIERVKTERGITVYIVLTPVYEGFPNDPSIQAYQQVADEVFFISEIGADSFLNTVETFEESNCL